MSESAKISLVGATKEQLLENIQKISDWDKERKYRIIVIGHEGKEHYDSIDNVERVIKEDRIDQYLTDISAFDMPNKPVKEPIKPDSIHKGSINFEIHWYGNQAHIIIEDLDFYKRVAMLYQVEQDLGILVDNMRTEPKKVKSNFTSVDKASTIRAKHLIGKFINSYLINIWNKEHPVERPDPRQAKNPVEEDEIAESSIREEQPKEEIVSNLKVVKDGESNNLK